MTEAVVKPDEQTEVHNALSELKQAVDTKNAATEKKALDAVLKIEEKMSEQAKPVSYTHLTLPTIYSV